MRLLLFPLLLLWPAWWEAEGSPLSLTPDEARSALQAARSPEREPGSWQAQGTRTTRTEEITETRTELREAGRPVLRRVETVRRSKKHPERVRTSVRLQNGEGTWELVGDAAIRWPDLMSAEELAGLKIAAQAKVSAQAKQLAAEGRQNDPAARAALIAQYTKHSGVRETTGAGSQLRVRLEFGPEAQKLMREMADEAWKRQKQQMSLGLRLVASPIYAAKRDDFLPVAQETVIDETTGLIVSQQFFSKDGKPIPSRGGPKAWKPIAPLTPEAFAVPAGLKRIEAKSLPEFEELKKQHRGTAPAAAVEAADESETETGH